MEHAFLLCVDVRFPGGTSSAVISEIKSISEHFESDEIGIVLVESALFAKDAPPNESLLASLRDCPFNVYRFDIHRAAFLDWRGGGRGRGQRHLHAGYLIIHSPYVALALAGLAGRLTADVGLIICHQPYVDKAGVPYYSAADIIAGVGEIARQTRFVPIGAAARRGFLSADWTSDHLAGFDWPNVFHFAPTTGRSSVRLPSRETCDPELLVIGRHSRPDWAKWPSDKDVFKQIYQHGTKRHVRFLGWGSHCETLFKDDIPRNWDVLHFNAVEPEAFLQTIDLFVYFHHSNWVEGFGRTVPEAIAAGVPCILSAELAATFGGAALYAPPDRVSQLLDRLDHRRNELAEWSGRARDLAKEAFGSGRIVEVYQHLFDARRSGVVDSTAFATATDSVAENQKQCRRALDAGFAIQEQLRLTADQTEPWDASGSKGVSFDKPDSETQSRTTDYAIYMDLRSARSDAWRTVELAESLHKAGYAVAGVHVETTSKTDLADVNPIFNELDSEIPIFGRAGDAVPHPLHVRKGVIIAAPHLMFGEGGHALFTKIVRPVTSQVVVLLTKKQAPNWYGGAGDSISLIFGEKPKFAIVGIAAEEVRAHLPEAVEAPELAAFVANRTPIGRRELLRHIAGRRNLRRGRIGLTDASQWCMRNDACVENFGGMSMFTYAASSARLLPADLQRNSNCHHFRFEDISVTRFLEKIDLITYFPTDKPSDLLLIPILRAVQAGTLAIVDGGLRKHLGSLAIYSTPEDLATTIEGYGADPDYVVRAALSKARDLAIADLQTKAVERIESLVSNLSSKFSSAGPKAHARIRAENPEPEVLFISSNGVGLGHLTRLMAIARRLERASPVFLTMSQAFRVVEASGWPVKYLPYHEVAGCDVERWNRWLKFELEQILASRPAVNTVVFDGSNPYSGLLSAFASTNIRKVWIQRGMWKEGQMNEEYVRRGKNFDVIIEPTDIAESLAAEAVESVAFDKVRTNPIWLLQPDELLSRADARKALSIPKTQRSCLIQLGSGTNNDIVSVLNTIIPILKKRGITPYIAEWLMGSEIPRIWPGVVYLRIFPLAKYFKAFDFCISAVGYNSFHELIGFGMPTIFIANEHPMMDDQAARARFAMQRDAAIWMVEEAAHDIGCVIDMIIRDDVRATMLAGCAALTSQNGASDAARIIDALSAEMTSSTVDFEPDAEIYESKAA